MPVDRQHETRAEVLRGTLEMLALKLLSVEPMNGWGRSVRRRPGLTTAATLTLALGVGATSAVFGVVKQVLLTPLPYDHPERVVVVWSAWKGFDQTWLSYDEWEGWKARVPAFADIGLYGTGSANVDGDSPERVRIAAVQA